MYTAVEDNGIREQSQNDIVAIASTFIPAQIQANVDTFSKLQNNNVGLQSDPVSYV